MKALCVLGQHNYGDASRGLGYEFVNFLPALRTLGYEPVFFESLDRSRYRDFTHLNQALIEVVEREAPDVILCVLLNYEVWSETLDLIRARCAAPLVNWATDDSWKYEQFSRYQALHVDLWATTSAAAAEKAKRDGHHNFFLTQWAADAAQLRPPLPASKCRYDVTFVGSAYGNRAKWVARLRSRGIAVQCFGQGWPAGPVATEDVLRIYRESRISLNFADSGLHLRGLIPYRSRQVKARVFEIPGAGGFLLTQRAPELGDWYRLEEEVASFDSIEELAEKVGYYLANSEVRDQVARAGHLCTAREHTYDKRFAPLLAAAFLNTRRRSQSDTGIERFQQIAAAHRQSRALGLLRAGLVGLCMPIWGGERGARAARRILFEICWRVCGAATYCARGWPGRLFYCES